MNNNLQQIFNYFKQMADNREKQRAVLNAKPKPVKQGDRGHISSLCCFDGEKWA